MASPNMPPGPPYPLPYAAVGGVPSRDPDVPASAVLLALFATGAVTNMTLFRRNLSRGHKFLFSALLFGFCMARIAALSMRIAWSLHPTNVDVAIAANVMTAAGVLLLFVINLFFSQRILRAYRPALGWHPVTRLVFRFLLGSVIALLIMVVVTSVHTLFTLDPVVRQREREVALFAGTYLAVLAFLPIPIIAFALLAPARPVVPVDEKGQTPDIQHPEPFGAGSMRTKALLVMGTSALLTLGAGFRIGANFAARPVSDPAWYHSRAAFYVFNFGLELLVVFAYTVSRFDRRFHIPNGSSAHGHYSGAVPVSAKAAPAMQGDVEEGTATASEDGGRNTK